MEKNTNDALSITRFVNISEEEETFYYDNQPWKFEPLEQKQLTVHLAKHFMKHLIDKLLQKKGIHNTLAETPLRISLKAQILPELAEEAKVKPLSNEEFLKELQKQQAQQKSQIEELSGKAKENEERDKELQTLKEQVALLTEKLEKKEEPIMEQKPKGRPKKQ